MNAPPHALVTGGGSGIGLAIAVALADARHPVTVVGRSADRLAAASTSARGLSPMACDVTDQASLSATVTEAARQRGPVGVLINCAGVARTAAFEKADDALWDEAWQVNVLGAVHATRAVLPGMRQLASGRILNIASTAALKGYAYVSAYTASKHALLGLTRALAVELARTPITVNAVCPGYTDTDIVRQSIATIVERTSRSAAEAREVFVGANPQGRLIDPSEVSAAVLWLVGDAARSITGQAITIAGGEVM